MVNSVPLTPAERTFYTTQSATSAAGDLTKLLDPLPPDPPSVVRVVSRLVIHPVALARNGVVHPHVAARDAEARDVRELLRRLGERDPVPLEVARPVERRIVGTCRHYALLATSIFRHHGIPSRVRVGFARYFVPGFHEDHWVCEYRDESGWRLLDAELGEEAVAKQYAIDFPPTDVPRDRFLTAGEVWRGLRRREIDDATCGVSFIPAVRGAWFVGASILRDLAALNGRELMPWDYWGLARDFRPGTTIPPASATRLDHVADVLAGSAPEWSAVRELYEGAQDLRVPPTVLSFPGDTPVEVAV
jgi:transglutaminase superfamily protein